MRRTITACFTVLLLSTLSFAQVPATPQILSTPIQLQVGATNATAGNTTGARNSTIDTLNQTPAASSIPEPQEDIELDLLTHGSGQVSTAYRWPVPSSMSLGEIARLQQNRPKKPNVRLYTNEDVERLRQESRVYGSFEHPALIQASARTDVTESREIASLAPLAPELAEANSMSSANAAKSENSGNPADKELPNTGSMLPLLGVLGALLGMAGITTRRWIP